jgi:adenylate kinase
VGKPAEADVRLVLMGAPGSGKGTQAKLLGEHINVPHISSGDILRDAIRRNTTLGMKAKTFMDRGELVPDDVLLGVMEERLREPDCRQGFILDGFPRTVPQAESLRSMLAAHQADIDRVAWIRVPTAELVTRLSGRRTCRNCGALYHVSFDPPKKRGVCDKCGGELFQRDDDREETIIARLKVYEKQTAPLSAFYGARSLLVEIDGVGATQDVLHRLLTGVGVNA